MSGLKSLGILPVRSGSEGIPGKNARLLSGRPLMAWAGEALASSGVSFAFCSTDSIELANIAQDLGLTALPIRPAQIATSASLVKDTVRHVLLEQQELGREFDHVVLVQATSPFVTATDIDDALRLLSDPNVDSVVSVTSVPDHFHPAIMYRNVNGRLVVAGDRSDSFIRRQDRKPWFRRVGLVYGFKAGNFLENSSFVYGSVSFLHIDEARAIDIDSESDFLIAETWVTASKSNSKLRGKKS